MSQSFRESALELARQIAAQYGEQAQVEAVALGGSLATLQAETGSDIDLYVYSQGELPLAFRQAVAQDSASRSEVNNQFWEPGDEWIDARNNIHVDVMFRDTRWIEAQLDRVLVQHQASVGYSTCFWHNVLTSTALFDRTGWYANLQVLAQRPYPPQLQQNIIAKNFPILRNTLSSYLYQINSAARRGDSVSLNHRVAALLASYFDILFALNKLPHPGEKRLLQITSTQCQLVPDHMEAQVSSLLQSPAEEKEVNKRVNTLIDGLETLLSRQGALDNA